MPHPTMLKVLYIPYVVDLWYNISNGYLLLATKASTVCEICGSLEYRVQFGNTDKQYKYLYFFCQGEVRYESNSEGCMWQRFCCLKWKSFELCISVVILLLHRQVLSWSGLVCLLSHIMCWTIFVSGLRTTQELFSVVATSIDSRVCCGHINCSTCENCSTLLEIWRRRRDGRPGRRWWWASLCLLHHKSPVKGQVILLSMLKTLGLVRSSLQS